MIRPEVFTKDPVFQVGQRVELHPALDRWMRGDRFGTVEKVGRKNVQVRMDRSGALVPCRAHVLTAA